MAHFLKQTTLVTAAGAAKEPVAKTLALYFAADWCPDCRDFQPTLNEFYRQVNATSHELDIVFVGSDATEADQLAHFREKQGPWLMIPFADPLRDELKRKYGVCAGKEKEAVGVTDRVGGIPSLVVVSPTGNVVDLHGADKVAADGAAALQAWL
ncbi:hypothetical protein SDRG_01775 [Saprolegnia diclina VS20]|uniref:Thioredoxin domain-containing protein n=1 Tax=Saprolegnia diclina (strain VS20) TaxID=1156394 RepID=T0SCV1_SAPDV|nr:hypothetical protein SDRG_01775 [Saprolegnia diclina VS20]EQC40702.1 hypothetical protein SDRG_01775 [Saprolegnia diclina VS20]|eukprot:XP_008605546.1 hypothetical protein SDRG_01775 [Saprolegnia diclina VS20]